VPEMMGALEELGSSLYGSEECRYVSLSVHSGNFLLGCSVVFDTECNFPVTQRVSCTGIARQLANTINTAIYYILSKMALLNVTITLVILFICVLIA
jgi:hypothetical protein